MPAQNLSAPLGGHEAAILPRVTTAVIRDRLWRACDSEWATKRLYIPQCAPVAPQPVKCRNSGYATVPSVAQPGPIGELCSTSYRRLAINTPSRSGTATVSKSGSAATMRLN
jgi:hypothetical protein